MRGVPLLMYSRMMSSWPPAEFFDSTGPYCCGLVACGLVWQTRQDWLNSRMPSSSLSLGASVLAAGCARPASGQAASKNNQHATRHFIGWPRIGTAARMFRKHHIGWQTGCAFSLLLARRTGLLVSLLLH